MKKLVSILICAFTVATAALSVSAASGKGSYGEIPLYKGAITVDGKLDKAYTELGLKVEIAGDYPGIASETTGTMYALHNGKELYMAMSINSSHALADYGKTITTGAWADDSCEFYIDWKGDGSNSAKWMCWHDGQFIPSSDKAVGLKEYKVTKTGGKSYIMEFCFELSDGAKTGSEFGWYVMVTSNSDPKNPKQEFIAVPTLMDGVKAANTAAEFPNMTLSAKEVKLPEATTAPATFDVLTVSAIAAALSGAGVIVSKKKH